MTGCLAKAAGVGPVLAGGWMGPVVFGLATLIGPEPPEDWWSRYRPGFCRGDRSGPGSVPS